MDLTAKKIGFFSPDNARVEKLLLELFPERERFSINYLRFRSLWRMVDYFGYYDESGAFCGFSYVIFTEKMAFILFLAVDSAVHSKGYGSEIMRMIAARHPGKEIALNCEAKDDKAENAEQRVRRICFYERFGLHVTDYLLVEEEDAPYSIMSSGDPFSLEEYLRLIKVFGYGLYKPNVRKAPGITGAKGSECG